MEVEFTYLWDRILRDGMLQKEKAIEDLDYPEAAMCRDAMELASMYKTQVRYSTLLETKIKELESQLAAQASAVEGIKKAIHDQGLDLIEEGGEYRLELKPVESPAVRDFLNLSVMARAALVNGQDAKEER